MANTSVFETKFSNRMQVTRYSTPVYTALASFEEREKMVNGQSVVRPTFSRLYADSYTRGSDMTARNYTETTETLTINTTPAILLSVDNFDAIQQNTNVQQRLADDGMRAVNKFIDADFLAEVVNATSTVDAGDVGGTAGSAIVLDPTNVLKVYAAARRKLSLQNVDVTGMGDPRIEMGNMKPGGQGGYAAVNPYFYEQFIYSMAGRETPGGDQLGVNAYMGKYFGFDNYESTNGYAVDVLSIATTPTDGDTVTINGVVFTFKTTLGATPGNVAIGGSADAARLNLAELINSPSTTDAGQVALTEANQNLMRGLTATDDAGANTLTLVGKGFGYIVATETLTDATDAWTSKISHQMFGVKGAVDMVIQSKVGVQVSDIPMQLGKYIKPNALYGKKTFTEGAQQLVDVKINSSLWV